MFSFKFGLPFIGRWVVAFFRLRLNKHPAPHFYAHYPLSFQKKCLSLQCVRIEGSAEVRPLNVSTTAQAKAAGTE